MKHAVRLIVLGFLLSLIPTIFSSPASAQIGVGISVRFGPPALPVYEQPLCPGDGYLWTPGYWSWSDDDGYYWVPGTWVEAPTPGLLWTPGYWGWNDGVYAWNGGYWGQQIGFYGGINYGFGYGGNGFEGGEWREGHFFYNRSVTNVNVTNITNVYNKTVIVNNTHVAFNGGQGGVQVRPTAEQERFAHETHTPPVASQREQEHAASQNRALFASANHGRPAVAATARPGEFSGHGVVAAKAAGGTYRAPKMSPKEARSAASAGNRAGENRASENRPAENREKEAAKPGNHATTAHTEPHNNVAHPAPKRSTEPREGETHAAKTAPKATPHTSEPKESTARNEKARPAAKPRTESEPKASAPKESAPKATHSTPKPVRETAPKHESAPKESTPKANAKPSPTPKPAKEPKPAKTSEPKPQKTSAPKPAPAPQHESAPKVSATKPSEPKASAKPAAAPKPAAEPKQSAPKEHKG